MNIKSNPEYQTPMVCVQQIASEGVLCGSVTTDSFTVDKGLSSDDF